MNKIGIIAGGGVLPLLICKSLESRGYNICVFYVNNNAKSSDYKNYENEKIEINSFSNILSLFKKYKIDEIVMVGKVNRPAIKDIKFDLTTISLIKNLLLESKGDDQLLKTIAEMFLEKGYPLFKWKDICTDLFIFEKNLTYLKPSKQAIKNMNKALEIFKYIGQADIGQSIVVQNQLILGIECIEGTNELIQRCDKYKKKGDKNILVKLSKYNQHNELDLPTIGIETFEYLKRFSYEGIFIEKNNCIVVEKEKVINFCNKNNLFLSSVNKIEKI